jgi:hypothetical protein
MWTKITNVHQYNLPLFICIKDKEQQTQQGSDLTVQGQGLKNQKFWGLRSNCAVT